MSKPVVVIAHWQMSAESSAAVLGLVGDLAARSLAEPGCVGYEIFESVDGPTQLVLVERYVDRAALDAHTRSAHYQELVAERIRPLLTDRQVHFLEAVDVGQSDLDNG
ncbi:putative quinol monooxygenase [Mycolicibacterium vinylchloridicum]|uniref:putative quinol monooxygenase n=1 Tax=Mycolicibacterium vinylchloridicum TaxID=2736928 RepID=UPI0015CBFB1F|nr:putative quinol monooxygenase [Mycolicibacterium vinylchloridicum]